MRNVLKIVAALLPKSTEAVVQNAEAIPPETSGRAGLPEIA